MNANAVDALGNVSIQRRRQGKRYSKRPISGATSYFPREGELGLCCSMLLLMAGLSRNRVSFAERRRKRIIPITMRRWTLFGSVHLITNRHTPMSDFASESGHYYRRDGTPAYTIVGANGSERPTTLRDARKHGLLPSVTTVIRVAAAPALERYKRNQVLLAALTLPRVPDESESAWLARVEQDWQQHGKDAAERGTAIHGAIERHFRGSTDYGAFPAYVAAAVAELNEHCGPQQWSPERSFACPDIGYAGKTDLHSPRIVIDAKTKDGELPTKVYDDHIMQVAAYRRGLGLDQIGARGGILFVRRDKPEARFVEISAADLERGWRMFLHLLGYWQELNQYKPT